MKLSQEPNIVTKAPAPAQLQKPWIENIEQAIQVLFCPVHARPISSR